MTIAESDRQIIRECSKDETTYHRLLALYDSHHAEAAHYDFILNNVQDVIFETDADGNWVFLSPAWEVMTGFRVSDSLGKHFMDYIHPSDRKYNLKDFRMIVDQRMPTYHREIRYLTHEGGSCYFDVNARIILNDAGQFAGTVGVLRDISDRKQIEEQLANNMKDLKLAQWIASIGNWTFDPEVGVPVWSAEVYKIYERNPELGPLSLEDYREIYEGQHFDRFWTAVQTAISEGKPYDIKLHLSLPGGKQKWIHAICEPEPERGPAGHRLRGTIQDISVTHNAQEALQRSQQFIKAIADTAPVAIYVYDVVEFGLIYANKIYETQLGYTAEEITEMGEAFLDRIYHPEDAERWRKSDERIFADRDDQVFSDIYRFIRADGVVRWAEVSERVLTREPDGSPRQVIGIAQDITERKQMEDRLRESEARYRLLADHIHDLIVLHNLDGTVRYASPSSQRILGYTPHELQALPSNSIIHPDDLDIILEEIAPPNPETEQLPTKVYRIRHKSGVYIWLESEAVPIFNESGELDCFLASSRDITERKQMEDRLRRSEANVRAMLDSTLQSFTLIDRERRVVDADEEGKRNAERIFGKRLEAGASIYDFVLPRDHDSFTRNFQRALNGEQITLEKSFPTSDDTSLYFEIVYYPVIDDNGVVIGVCLSHQDITERKQMEDRLRTSEKRFMHIANNVPGMVYQFKIDAAGNSTFPFVSQNVAQYTSYTPEMIQQDANTLFDAVHPDDVDMVNTHIRESHQNLSIYMLTHRLITKDGETRWFHLRATPERLADGSTLWTGISLDVNQLAQTEAKLRASQDFLQRLIQQIPVGIQVFNTDGLCTEINQAHLDIFGVERDDLVGAYNIFTDTLADEMSTRDAAERALTGETVHLGDLEFDFKRADPRYAAITQSPRTINVSIVPIFDGQGEVNGFVGVNMDITESRRALQRHFDLALERERMQLLMTFIQNTAHEFRTPLATINTSAFIMSRTDNRARFVEKHGEIENQVKRITHLLDMLLLMVRLENTYTIRQKPIDLDTLTENICDKLASRYGTRPQCNYRPGVRGAVLLGDPEHITDALTQVLDNAYRFTPSDGTIMVSIESTSEAVQVIVQDTGIGISVEDQARIFETFWRNDQSHSTPGFGLGLPIARRIIELHGGEIDVASVPEQGTTVTIRLPRSTQND